MEAVSYLDWGLGILALLILFAGIWMLVSGVSDLNR